jgi:cyclic pyranopterin phosphate synthase
MSELPHFDAAGAARMVDVSPKPETARTATATATVRMAPETLGLILDNRLAKGDVLAVARLAGILGAKKTADLIPLCHPLPLTGVTLDFTPLPPDRLLVRGTARVFGRTGVEMEAMTAVSLAALTVYDMAKAVDRGMTIDAVRLEAKSGGTSGDFRREADPAGGS